jgi:hypothetical protein
MKAICYQNTASRKENLVKVTVQVKAAMLSSSCLKGEENCK